jgi:hypothetical protein
MIFTIGNNNEIIFDLNIQSPWDWIDCLNNTFPDNHIYIACYGQYENCIIIEE